MMVVSKADSLYTIPMSTNAHPQPAAISLPDIPALCANAREAALLTTEGEIKILSHEEAAHTIEGQSVLVCHAPYTRARLNFGDFYHFDVLELFAFTHPATFCVPTPHGVSKALGLTPPESFEDSPLALIQITRALLQDLQKDPFTDTANAADIASVMGQQGKGWPWTDFIFAALGQTYDPQLPVNGKTAMNIWRHLPEWAEEAPPPPPSHYGVSHEEIDERLAQLRGHGAEERPAQMQYAHTIGEAFAPLHDENKPHIVLAEAGTGTGKTLGYLAPASVWAEKNDGAVWISTYTKNLQRQINSELDRLYPTPEVKEAHVAVRKGRENYLCLLNLEDTAAAAALSRNPQHAIGAGIMARWAAATKDGDLSGADYPGWLTGLLGFHTSQGLADKRGECIYSACDHYHKCFVERSIRKAKHARIVIANHALAMISSALAGPGEEMPQRYIFDEGHHLFDAADSAFSAHLSAIETRDLRRWILGGEGGKRTSRARGLVKRAEDLAAGDTEAEAMLQRIMHEATCLTADGWTRRLKDSLPSGPTESFLHLVYKQTYARSPDRDGAYSLETPAHPLENDVLEAARALKKALKDLQKPMAGLARIFTKKLVEDEGHMDSDTRNRLDAVATALERRATMMLQAWIGMLDSLEHGETPDAFTDWLAIERVDGRAIDVGLYRHWINPIQPFAEAIKPHLHGMAITSATLNDTARAGARLLNPNTTELTLPSPFDYAKQTKVIIINDVNKNSLDQVAGATRALFEASGGGALGLFTAISRLRAVHGRIAQKLEENHIPLYAQHIDEMDSGTLVDIFREDERSCLLGTDAMRDGVDVPGNALRLVLFDRTPWPRPTILHKARREEFGGRQYDEALTRLKLKQAFGRLIRAHDDKGVFVMLDSALPSRLHDAFPPETEIIKCGLGEACAVIRGVIGYTEVRNDHLFL